MTAAAIIANNVYWIIAIIKSILGTFCALLYLTYDDNTR